LWLKAALLFVPGVVVIDVPLVPEEASVPRHADHPVEPGRHSVLILVSGVHSAVARAVAYAKSLRPSEVEALYIAMDPEAVDPIIEAWWDRGMDVPLSLVEAPFRDIAEPLLEEVRRRTSRGDVLTVVLPEFIVRRWWEHLLHNQTGLYVKRLLLTEPRVAVASVPFHLAAAPAPVAAPDPTA
jgi:hypothetical protein